MIFNNKQILGSAEYDTVTNSLTAYDAAGKVLGDGTHLFATFAPCIIADIVVTPLDVTFSDPSDDIFLGYVLDYTLDFSAYTVARTQIADADCPMLWKDAGTPDVPDFSLGVPTFLFDFKGKGSVTGHTGTNVFGGNAAAPAVRIPANALVRLRLATYGSGTLAAISGVDNLQVAVIGTFV